MRNDIQSKSKKTSNIRPDWTPKSASSTQLVYIQGRIKGGATGAIAPGPPLQRGPRDDKYLF